MTLPKTARLKLYLLKDEFSSTGSFLSFRMTNAHYRLIRPPPPIYKGNRGMTQRTLQQ